MATYDLVFNIAKGRVAELCSLSVAGSSLIAVPLLTAGIVNAATMRDYTTLDAVLAGASDEQPNMGRKPLSNVVVATDQAGDRKTVDCDDVTWTAATGGPVSAVLFCYKPAANSVDTAIIPLVCLDMAATPNGGDITYQVNVSGFYNAA